MHQIKQGLLSLKEMWKESHRKALLNFFGGFLFYISHHGVEFSAQLILLLVAGNFIFNQIGDLATASFQAIGIASESSESALKSTVMGFLWFLHVIDDPLAILPVLLEPMHQAMTTITETKRNISGIVPAYHVNAALLSQIETLEFKEEVFGSMKTFDKMNITERAVAYEMFQKFICLNSDNGTVRIPGTVIPEARSEQAIIISFKCSA